MSNLNAFLKNNVVEVENQECVVSNRFLDTDGNPIPWIIKPITSSEDEALRESCTKRVSIPGKKNQFIPQMDSNKYAGLLAVKCTVFPDLYNKELQDSYKVMGADELLKTMLLPGEYMDFLNKVQEINGFEISFEDKVEEAKN